MKEIGGYLELESFENNEYYKKLISVNSGRNALLYILLAKKIKKLYIPVFLCGSVRNLCIDNGIEYEQYNVNRDFTPAFEKKLKTDEYLYIVNYYGQITNSQLRKMKKQYGNIIFDNVMAFFQKPVSGIDTVYSCRKFFGVPDGGYASTDVFLEDELDVDVSKDRMIHILGRFEGAASDYYSDFKANENSFKALKLCYMSKLTHNILGAIDYKRVIKRRNENFSFLKKELDGINELDYITPDGPYAYPLYIKNGMSLKKKLAESGIYIATLWPDAINTGDDIGKDLAENILPLPCDQRYTVDDIKIMILEIRKCLN